MEILNQISELLQKGKMKDVTELTQKSLSEGIAASKILDDALVKGMSIIGEKFKKNEVYVPEVLIAARAMNAALKILEPELLKNNVKAKGIIVIGTVKGDLHDIGKNLVAIMFKGAGFTVVDCGVDVSAEKFVEEAKKSNADLIGLSALLTTTMVNMKEIVTKAHAAGVTAKILIGGAPVTDNFAREIKADGYAPDAASAVDIAKTFLN
ncbi:MAG: methyltransferase [Spirochaetes bacterium GWF1_41_5]|nr:MAG: methyltransferase [Spirochaetes bacterium GWF1_41_5]HBE04079.1 cobalamin-binding protein [Spirochaetia bacterium]